MGATRALARRAFSDARARNASFAVLFALVAYAQAVAYRSDYPTQAERLSFAHAFAGNASLRLFYGRPFDLLTTGGYVAWRVGGIVAILAGVWGLLAAVRALRAEEEAGRTELVLAAPVARSTSYRAALLGCAAGVVLLWLALLLATVGGGLPARESAYFALAVLSPAPVFVGVGALASQLAPTRRLALELACAALVLALVLRVIADTSASLQWLDWLTPLGWAEQMRPFTGARPAVLLLPAAASLALVVAAERIWLGRDLSSGVLPSSDSSAPRVRGLSSVTAQALRSERASFAGWLVAIGCFALVIGLVSTSITSAGISASLQRQLKQVGGISILTPSGYIGLCFLFFVLVVSLFACSQVAAARHEEAQERLETLFALPVGRREWLGGRFALALAGVFAISIAAGLLAWLGAVIAGASVSLSSMLEAGVNCVPVALLFLALAGLAFALAPRASIPLAYGAVAVSFVWQLLSAALSAPDWLRELSPFEHVGLVPAQPLRAGAAGWMLALAALLVVAALAGFGRRDLVGA